MTAHEHSSSERTLTVPLRTVWIGGGLLAVVAVGLAAVLLTRPAAAPPEAAPLATGSAAAPAAEPAPTPAPTAAPVVAAPVDTTPPKAGPAPTPTAVGVAEPAAPAQPAPVAVEPAPAPPVAAAPPPVCKQCGVVESVVALQQKGQGTGLGAVAGGVVGGVVGHQFGGGSGKTAMTVLGAVGGGLAGNAVEKNVRSTTTYELRVRMDDHQLRTVQRAEPLAVGTRVIIDGSGLRLAGANGNGG